MSELTVREGESAVAKVGILSPPEVGVSMTVEVSHAWNKTTTANSKSHSYVFVSHSYSLNMSG